MKRIIAAALFALVSACAITGDIFGPTPESKILNGANAVTAAANLATVLLKNNKITVQQAKGYSALLHTASAHLDTSYATLIACRKVTKSTRVSDPDPCEAGIADDIKLALSVVGEVHKTLNAKQ